MLSTPITVDVGGKMDNVFCLVALQLKNSLITFCDSGTAVKSEEFRIRREKEQTKGKYNVSWQEANSLSSQIFTTILLFGIFFLFFKLDA